MSTAIAVEGHGLHSGERAAVRFERHDGPVMVRSRAGGACIAELRVVDTTRSTTVAADGGFRLATIEHLFAALGGLGLHRGVAVVVDGHEAPLADGGARVYADMLASLGVASSPPSLRIARDGVVELGASRYELTRGHEVEVEVEVDFDDPRLEKSARWAGDPQDFLARIAVARTFGFEHELEDLLVRGLASHVTPESVVVIGEGRILSAGTAFSADEPARHKLLDLIGDLYVHGGPPRGRVRAIRPGHAATHEVMRRALDQGLVIRQEG